MAFSDRSRPALQAGPGPGGQSGSCRGNSREAAPGSSPGRMRDSGGDSWASSEFTQSAPLCQMRNLSQRGWGKQASPSPTTGQVLPSTGTQVTLTEVCGPVGTVEAQGGGGMSLGHTMRWGSSGIRPWVPSFPRPPRGCCPRHSGGNVFSPRLWVSQHLYKIIYHHHSQSITFVHLSLQFTC